MTRWKVLRHAWHGSLLNGIAIADQDHSDEPPFAFVSLWASLITVSHHASVPHNASKSCLHNHNQHLVITHGR